MKIGKLKNGNGYIIEEDHGIKTYVSKEGAEFLGSIVSLGPFYKAICDLQKLLWQDDDLMDQDALFEAQDKVSTIALDIANKIGKVDDLVKQFPWLYEVKK